MIVIRPICSEDLNALHTIACESGEGLTSLPDNKPLLADKIAHSTEAFGSHADGKKEAYYLFIMQDTVSSEIVGTSAIEACVGVNSPLYFHRIDSYQQQLDEPKITKHVETLSVGNHLASSSEICSLYLQPQYRKDGNGRLLSRARFLFMAQHPQRFSTQIIAEMRGYVDNKGNSPFWQWFEEHFCAMDFSTSNRLISQGDQSFVEALMPKFPIYKHLMSAQAQAAINQVHPDTRPALAMLRSEYFTYGDFVGVNDGGPAMVCELSKIKTVGESITLPVVISDLHSEKPNYIACNQSLENFRAAQIYAQVKHDNAVISTEVASALLVENGDLLRLSPI